MLWGLRSHSDQGAWPERHTGPKPLQSKPGVPDNADALAVPDKAAVRTYFFHQRYALRKDVSKALGITYKSLTSQTLRKHILHGQGRPSTEAVTDIARSIVATARNTCEEK